MTLIVIKKITFAATIILVCLFNFKFVSAASGANFKFEIISYCGNGNMDSGEQCDGTHLAGNTCVTRNFPLGGVLTCRENCSFNTSQCIPNPQAPGGGGGGGTVENQYDNPTTSVVFEGRAYPKSIVTILKDAQVAATTIAGSDARFAITLSGLSGGNYIFSIYGEDSKGVRSSLLTFPASVTPGATNKVSGIFVAPTISVDKVEVARGENIAIFGQTNPNSEVTISVHSDQEYFNKVKSDSAGAYLYNFDTTPLEDGQHLAKSRSSVDAEISSGSLVAGFFVGAKNILIELPKSFILKGDLNGDGRVNLVDFSIISYWYKRPSPPISADLNGDGSVNISDFSILAFNWTG